MENQTQWSPHLTKHQAVIRGELYRSFFIPPPNILKFLFFLSLFFFFAAAPHNLRDLNSLTSDLTWGQGSESTES